MKKQYTKPEFQAKAFEVENLLADSLTGNAYYDFIPADVKASGLTEGNVNGVFWQDWH